MRNLAGLMLICEMYSSIVPLMITALLDLLHHCSIMNVNLKPTRYTLLHTFVELSYALYDVLLVILPLQLPMKYVVVTKRSWNHCLDTANQ